jgi:D-sedoheptulose 7-phosphate isomerase
VPEIPQGEPANEWVADYLTRSVDALIAFARDRTALEVLAEMGRVISASLRNGGKLLVAGNGGSAGDAQHVAGEFVSRFIYDRVPLASIALTTDSSVITATGNDYGFDHIFARQVRGIGRSGDVLLGLSTSGNSANLIRAFEAAQEGGLRTLGFTGNRPSKMAAVCELLLRAPSSSTPIIQQIHTVAAHILCADVEATLCPRQH